MKENATWILNSVQQGWSDNFEKRGRLLEARNQRAASTG